MNKPQVKILKAVFEKKLPRKKKKAVKKELIKGILIPNPDKKETN